MIFSDDAIYFTKDEILSYKDHLTQEEKNILNENVISQVLCPPGVIIRITAETRKLLRRMKNKVV